MTKGQSEVSPHLPPRPVFGSHPPFHCLTELSQEEWSSPEAEETFRPRPWSSQASDFLVTVIPLLRWEMDHHSCVGDLSPLGYSVLLSSRTAPLNYQLKPL